MDCLAMVFFDEFEFLNIFRRSAGAWSPSTDTQPALKLECHSKTAVWLKECFPKASQSTFRVSVVDLHKT
jgi:hypothetical protein